MRRQFYFWIKRKTGTGTGLWLIEFELLLKDFQSGIRKVSKRGKRFHRIVSKHEMTIIILDLKMTGISTGLWLIEFEL